jgi:SAM-dependent methyltransferase
LTALPTSRWKPVPLWRTIPRRILMRSRLGRRLWWHTRGRNSELDFWRAWLVGALGAEEWESDRVRRFSPAAEIEDPLLRAAIDRLPQREISILDVGAGPVTKVGYTHPRRDLTIVPVDPLADDYDRLLRAAGLEPPVRTIRVAGGHLLDRFGPEHFDIAYATNSLDHSDDPMSIIENMVGVVRTGGSVLLRHARNEGEEKRYEGLHQWNFDVVEQELVVWNGAATVSVREALGDRAAVEAWIEDDGGPGQVLVRMVVAPS